MRYYTEIFTAKEINQFTNNAELVSFQETDTEAISYRYLVGKINPGDRLLVNTTAVKLNLGTGGYHFVISNLSSKTPVYMDDGKSHVMKMKYTPLQLAVPFLEENTGYKNVENERVNSQVLVTTLHSQISPLLAVFKKLAPEKTISLVIEDSAALPIYFSKTIPRLKQFDNLKAVITAGNAFGGDYEAINIYSSLIFASRVLKTEVIIVSLGPGVSGTSTDYGTSALFATDALNAAYSIGENKPIFVLRMSESDNRKRHLGVSHHSFSVLKRTLAEVRVITPNINDISDKIPKINRQLQNIRYENVEFFKVNTSDYFKILYDYRELMNTMGRQLNEDKLFFKACIAPAIYISENILNE